MTRITKKAPPGGGAGRPVQPPTGVLSHRWGSTPPREPGGGRARRGPKSPSNIFIKLSQKNRCQKQRNYFVIIKTPKKP